jgi:hypothetical protein
MKRDPDNSAPAQDAFLTAIAASKHQGTRSFELRAAIAASEALAPTAAQPTPTRSHARARWLCTHVAKARDRGGAGAVRDPG